MTHDPRERWRRGRRSRLTRAPHGLFHAYKVHAEAPSATQRTEFHARSATPGDRIPRYAATQTRGEAQTCPSWRANRLRRRACGGRDHAYWPLVMRFPSPQCMNRFTSRTSATDHMLLARTICLKVEDWPLGLPGPRDAHYQLRVAVIRGGNSVECASFAHPTRGSVKSHLTAPKPVSPINAPCSAHC